jgi:membrane associated rhomboid family serine protease
MFRKTTGTILCPSCGRLTSADARECLVCGRRNPGMWGFAAPLRQLVGRGGFSNVVTVVCVVLYIASLVLDPGAGLAPRGLLDVFAPSGAALRALGAAGADPWFRGHWWTIFTAIYLHGGLLHIFFNMLWIRQLGPAIEEIYGPARLVVIFTVAGAAGFVLSNRVGHPFTIGASGSVFGLLGAIVAFGYKRGGTYGMMVLKQYGYMALLIFVLSFFMRGVNNSAHAGGFIGGALAGLLMALAERRRETSFDWLLAAACIGVTALGFVLSLWTAFVG